MLELLGRQGIHIEWDTIRGIAGDGAIGRPHIARALVERGYVSCVDEAFERYIGRDGPAYAERYKLAPKEAVEAILEAGGIPALAHPIGLTHLVPGLCDAGLLALEVYYTNYSPDEVEHLLDVAHQCGLAPTGGSDFHGGGVLPDSLLGGVDVPYSCVRDLARLRALHRTLA
jgi:predicted metal-dependent phosphoesterase TrpH